MSGTDLTLLGLGFSPTLHLTPESREALSRCEEVLYVDTGVATQALLETLCPRVTPLYPEAYLPSHPRLQGYQLMVARTLEAALDHAPVAFAMQGHPVVYAHATPLLVRGAAMLGLGVRVLPGLSTFDALFAELLLDPCDHGLQAYEVTDLLLRRRPLQADVPLVLFQVGNAETRLHTTRRSRPERFQRLRAFLLQTYAPDQPVVAFFSAPHPLMRSQVWRFPLDELPAQAQHLHPGITLLLPPARHRPMADLSLLQVLDDPEHLARITC